MSGTVSNQSAIHSNGNAIQAVGQGATTNITTTNASQTVATVGANTNLVRLATKKACYVKIGGSDAVTSANGIYMPDGGVDYLVCNPLDVIRVIWETEAGIFSVMEAL